MKGVITKAIREMVVEQFDQDTWNNIMEKTGLPRNTDFLPVEDVDDAVALKVIESLCEVVSISPSQAADAFGDYWMNRFAPKIYGIYYKKHANAKDFLLAMDSVHVAMTRTLKDARPPRFDYHWEDDRTLIMHYKSHRGLIDFVVGLIKGVGKYYGTPLEVKKIDDKRVKVVFPPGLQRVH